MAGVLLLRMGIQSESSLSIHSTSVYPHATAVQVADALDNLPSHPSWWSAGSADLDGFHVLTRRGTSLGSVEGGYMTFTTGDTPEQVFEYYDSRLLSTGWKLLHDESVFPARTAGSGTPDSSTTAASTRDYIYRSALGSLATFNAEGYSNKEFDKLVEQAATTSEADRFKLYNQAEQLLLRDAPIILLYQIVHYWEVRPQWTGYGASGNFVYPFKLVRPNR